MPWHVDETAKCPASKPYGVIKDADGSVDGRCHPTREAAEKQMAALYAAEPQPRRSPVAEQLLAGPHPYVRSFPLEDIRIRSGDGRTVEAYAAVFDVPAEVRDQDGHYHEILDRTAFNRAISDAAPQGGRKSWRVGVFYNHGMTIYHTPSERGSVPIGVPMEVKADSRGLFTVTRYSRTALADEVLEMIRDDAITGYSFQGMFLRSAATDPGGRQVGRIPRGGFTPDKAGQLVTIRRMESTLREYGPTPFPAYAEAAVVGMRADLLAAHLAPLLRDALRDDAQQSTIEQLAEAGMTPDEALAAVRAADQSPPDAPQPGDSSADDPPATDAEHSSRHVLLQRIAAAKTTRPGLARDPHAEARRERVAAVARSERTGPE